MVTQGRRSLLLLVRIRVAILMRRINLLLNAWRRRWDGNAVQLPLHVRW